jgi:biotin synthase
MKQLIDRLEREKILKKEEFCDLLQSYTDDDREYLAQKARKIAQSYYGNGVYTRGLIEFTNYCKNDCYYCGIRKSNLKASRYRLTEEEILSCCQEGYALGFRTFVLQGGEDGYFTDDRMVSVISAMKSAYPDCAVTLSIGEKDRKSYERFFKAGADRYLLRHETATESHYGKLHPKSLSLQHRKQCLYWLKEIGYQVGSGFMVGSPYQTPENLAEDLLFLKELGPQMVGIGPFIPHQDTDFAHFPAGTLSQTLVLISILRLMFPNILIPATTALGTIHPTGREQGILAGANVVMPNLSPLSVRKKYLLYDNKICTGDEAAEAWNHLDLRMHAIGYRLLVDRGDCK